MTLLISQRHGYNVARYKKPTVITGSLFTSYVKLLMPMNVTPTSNLNTQDLAPSPVSWQNFSDFSLDSFSTILSTDTLFGQRVSALTQGSGFVWGGNSYTNNWHNWMAGTPAKLLLGNTLWTIEFNYFLDNADGNNCGGTVMTCGGYGYALGSGYPTNNYSIGRWGVGVSATGQVTFGQGTFGSNAAHFSITSPGFGRGSWNHVAICHYGNGIADQIMVYHNGRIAVGGNCVSYPMSSSGGYFGLGGMWQQSTPGPNYPFRGKLANVRITEGIIVYPGEFIPPSAPHPTS